MQQNIATLSTQLLSAEVLLDNALDGESSPTNASQGLPISEIIEELDEDGNVICMDARMTFGLTRTDLVHSR